ncbi:DUF4229 domain-containing protein [Microbacterium sp. YY-03]|uniref:DUF4229 domain-containing protein n=1 Tax=Microbacterium sp. YY-03 TaxID=3421636 RepID=UPI003D1657FB
MKLLVYSLLRLAAFVVPFVIMWQFAVFRELPWLAAIFAALIGLALSIIFLRKPLNEATSQMAARRNTVTVRDEDVEDDAVDATGDVPADDGQPRL